MINIHDTCLEFLKNNDIKKNMKELFKPIADIIYNEVYIYIWLICFYNLFLFFIILANLFLLIKLVYKPNINNITNPNNYMT